LMIK